MDLSSIQSVLNSNATNNLSSVNADKVNSGLNSLSSSSTEEELKGAIKDFESYFVEQMLKEIKESLKSDDEDGIMSQYQDFFMDTLIEEMADKLVDDCGETLTQQLYEQMRRNYNIPEADTTAVAEKTNALGATE